MTSELAKRSLDSSGRASPVNAIQRQPRRQVEDEPRRHDKTYRRYAAGIERALASFDTARLEWPDYISFLGRLLKAIQSHSQAVDNIPQRDVIANRLAQCLSPSLPSGVHQKAIEVYSYVFSLIGKETLAQDLHIYLPGLSPVLTFASLSLRPFFLSLVETYIVALNGAALRPALKALLLCLLPGLEEENSEEFERTLQIVDNLKIAITVDSRKEGHRINVSGEEYFWQCLFLAAISSASRRQGALEFLGKRLPKLNSNKDDMEPATDGGGAAEIVTRLSDEAELTISPEPGLLIRCFAAGLGDEQLLLQRGFLDLLLANLPLNSPVLTQRVSKDDLEHLVGAATAVVARRDMSLNRRLWSWFLGPEINDDTQESVRDSQSPDDLNVPVEEKSSYFIQFGRQPLINSVLKMIHRSQAHASEVARPFRICLSLMDRNEIGNRIIPHIFLPAMDSLLRYKSRAKDEDFQEVLRSANSFFDGIESGVIWGQMTELFAAALESSELDDSIRKEKLDIARFILDHFNVREEDMLALHVPLVTAFLISVINERQHTMSSVAQPMKYDEVVDLAIVVAEKLVDILPERAQLNDTFGRDDMDSKRNSSPGQQQTHLKKIKAFYTIKNGNFTVSPPPLSSRQTAHQLLIEATTMMMMNLHSSLPDRCTVLSAKLLSALISKLPDCQHPPLALLVDEFQEALQRSSSKREPSDPPFTTFAAITQVITQSVMTHPSSTESIREQLSEIVTSLVEKFWSFLSPTYPKYQLEAVRCIWQLDELIPSAHLIEASLANFLAPVQDSPEDHSPQFESARRFAVLWNHSTNSSNPQSKRVNSIWSKPNGTVWDMLPSQDTESYEPRLQRPLLLLLDAALDTDAALAYFLRDWIGSVPNLHAIFQSILRIAVQNSEIVLACSIKVENTDIHAQSFHQDARPQCLYYLQHILHLLKMPSDHMWTTLERRVKTALMRANSPIDNNNTLLEDIAKLCLEIVQERSQIVPSKVQDIDVRLQRTALTILQLVMRSPAPSSLQNFHIDDALIDVLMHTVESGMENSSLQVALLDTLATALELRMFLIDSKIRPTSYRNAPSGEVLKALSKVTLSSDVDGVTKDNPGKGHPAAPAQLFKCLQAGISASSSLHVMENWVNFLTDVLPLFGDTLFQNMIPMVDCLCSKVRTIFSQLHGIFKNNSPYSKIAPEPALLSLLGGLEFILTTAHDRMVAEEQRKAATKAPEPSQGFLSNVVSGVFSTEQKNRNAVGNTRLTVILCFQDAMKICLSIWAWSGYGREINEQDSISMASFGYVSQRLRNKARRILDRMFVAEALECLETLIVAWLQQAMNSQKPRGSTPMSLLHVLDGSRPKYAMPAIFNAIYSRTNPAAIDDGRMSSLTSDITDLELGQFLVDYTQSLDDDAMDEIWVDCMTFLRDVLTNPLPHHNILPYLLLFLVILAEKVGNTNFGEQRKMRKDLSDLFLRLLTAIFTTKSAGSLQEPAQALFAGDKMTNGDYSAGRANRRKAGMSDLVETLNIVLPRLPAVFSDTDRLVSAVSNISTNMILPALHSKSFPENVRPTFLHLWYGLTQVNAASKIWKKDISDALNHSKFFSSNLALVKDGWIPLLRQWMNNDKDRITEICGRIFAPTAAGNIFGVGASAARLDADKKTQLNLRRIAILTLAAEADFIITSIQLLEEKITELLHATAASSPSSATRAEIFMLIRALLLKTSPIHLATLWPVVTTELQRAIASALPRSKDYDVYNTSSLSQACKLLDLLLIVAPDDFQMHEWLFITDTIEAVYRPGHWEPVALVDDLAEELGSSGSVFSPEPTTLGQELWNNKRSTYKSPLLNIKPGSGDLSKEDFVRQILRPFFAQLSIHAYESTYSMKSPDWEACEDALLEDIFDDSTMVG